MPTPGRARKNQRKYAENEMTGTWLKGRVPE